MAEKPRRPCPLLTTKEIQMKITAVIGQDTFTGQSIAVRAWIKKICGELATHKGIKRVIADAFRLGLVSVKLDDKTTVQISKA
jgi:hypothetical protein